MSIDYSKSELQIRSDFFVMRMVERDIERNRPLLSPGGMYTERYVELMLHPRAVL